MKIAANSLMLGNTNHTTPTTETKAKQKSRSNNTGFLSTQRAFNVHDKNWNKEGSGMMITCGLRFRKTKQNKTSPRGLRFEKFFSPPVTGDLNLDLYDSVLAYLFTKAGQWNAIK